MRDPAAFVTLQTRLGRSDGLNEYIKHVGSGLWAIPPGATRGRLGGRDAALSSSASRSALIGGGRCSARQSSSSSSPPVAQPGGDVGDGLGDRAAAQARGLRALGADLPRVAAPAATAAAPSTARRSSCLERVVRRSSAARRRPRRASSSPIVVCPIGAGAVEGAGDALLGEVEQEGREVARVDHLHAAIRVARRGHDAALRRSAAPTTAAGRRCRAGRRSGRRGRTAPARQARARSAARLVRAVALAVLPRRRVLVDRLVAARPGRRCRWRRRRSGRRRAPPRPPRAPGRSREVSITASHSRPRSGVTSARSPRDVLDASGTVPRLARA